MNNLYKVILPTTKSIRYENFVKYSKSLYKTHFEKWQPKQEAYESIFLYSESQYETAKQSKTLMGTKDVYTDLIVFDFDDKLDLNAPFQDMKTLVNRLLNDGFTKNEILVYYSSNKGFHVAIHLNSYITHSRFVEIVMSYAEDLKTFDVKVQDPQRIFRMPLSFNPISSNYKIPLDLDGVFESDIQMQDIKNYAKSPDVKLSIDTILNITAVDDKFVIKIKKETKKIEITLDDVPDFTNKRKEITEAKYALEMGFFEPGERNEAYLILAATYRYLAYAKDHAHNMIKATDRLHVQRCLANGIKRQVKPKEEIWTQVIEPVYSPNWKGGTFSELENPLLIKTKQRYNIRSEETKSLIESTHLGKIFQKFAVDIDKNTIKLGFPEIDKDIQITTSMLVYLLAAPSAGKSSISFSIMNNASLNNIDTLFFSLDMGAPLVYQRLLQKHNNIHSTDLFNLYKNNDSKIKTLEANVIKNYKNVKFSFRSGVTVDDIQSCMIDQYDKNGKYPKLVIVDYLECLTGPFSDATANGAYIAQRLKDIANQFECTVLLLVQPQKSAGDPSSELLSMRSVKGASVLEQAASIILTLSRPGFNPKTPEDDKYAMVSVVKNRMGQLKTWDFSWDGLTGHIRSLMDEERKDLAELRDRKKQSEMQKDGFNAI